MSIKIDITQDATPMKEELIGLSVLVYPKGEGAIFQTDLHSIVNTPSKNTDNISSEVPKEDFPIYLSKDKLSYITVKWLFESMEDDRVSFFYQNQWRESTFEKGVMVRKTKYDY